MGRPLDDSRAKKYDAKLLGKFLKEHLDIDVKAWSDMEWERNMARGQILDWSPYTFFERSVWQKLGKGIRMPRPGDPKPVFEYGAMGPTGHLVNFIDMCWDGWWKWYETVYPTASSTQSFRVQNHWAQRCMWDLVHRRRGTKLPADYNILSGPGSSGKTGVAAMFGVSMFYIFRDTLTEKVVSTTKQSAEDRIWGQLVDMHEAGAYARETETTEEGRFHIVHSPDSRLMWQPRKTGTLEKYAKRTTRGIQLVPVTRGADGAAAVRRMVGIKAHQKLLIIDEANAVDPSVYADNLISNWHLAEDFSQIAYLFNPTWSERKSVEFYRPKLGWNDPEYHLNATGWETARSGYVTNLNGLDTPNHEWRKTNDPKRTEKRTAPFPFLISITDIENNERTCGGRDTPAFWQMSIGFLTDEASVDTILTPRRVEESGAQGKAEWTGEGLFPILGIDPAFGGDRFQICYANIGYGMTMKGDRKVFMEVEKFITVPFILKTTGTPEAGQVRFVMELAGTLNAGAESIASDATGASTGFVYPLEKELGKEIHRVYFSAAPSERLSEPGDRRLSNERFVNAASEIAYSVRGFLPFIRNLNDNDAIDQGCNRKFEIKGRDKIAVESKVIYKQRVGASPDAFDALSVAIDLGRSLGLGTDLLSHPQAVAGRIGKSWRIVTKASYRRSEERVGLARYGVGVN